MKKYDSLIIFNEKQIDEYTRSFVYISSAIVIVLSSIFLLTYLSLNIKTYPYTYQSNFWLIIIVISIIISQCYSIVYHILIASTSDNQGDAYIINSLFITDFLLHPLIFIGIIARTFSIAESINYNTNAITSYFNSKQYRSQYEDEFNTHFFKKQFRYLQVYIGSFGIVSVFFMIMFYTKEIKECLDLMFKWLFAISLGDPSPSYASIKITLGFIIYYVEWYWLLFFFLTILMKIFRYKLSYDRYKIKLEIMPMIFIFFIKVTLRQIYIFFNITYHKHLFILASDSILHFIIILIYIITAIIRYCTYSKFNMQFLMKDFDAFMSKLSCFTLFKNYVENNNNEFIRFILFWVEYNNFIAMSKEDSDIELFKRDSNNYSIGNRFMNEHMNQRKIEEMLRERAKDIFKDFFMMNNSTITISNIRSTYTIEFPPDIADKVNETLKGSYVNDNFIHCFDEAHIWVKEKLEKVYEEFKSRNEDMKKLERIQFFIECYNIPNV